MGDPRPARAHASVRMVLVLLVLLPTVTTVYLASTAANARWAYRTGARSVAAETTVLDTVLQARAELNAARIPASAISFAQSFKVDEPTLSSLLHVDFASTLQSSLAAVSADRTLRSTAQLRADARALEALTPGVGTSTSYDQIGGVFRTYCNDVNTLWLKDFADLQHQVSRWQPPGSIDTGMTALRQTFAAYLAGLDEVEAGNFVLNGEADKSLQQQMIGSADRYATAAAQLAGVLGPLGQAAWQRLQHSPETVAFAADLREAVDLAVNGGPAPFATDIPAYAAAFRDGLQELDDLSALVLATSADLHGSALRQEAAATDTFVREVALLLLLTILSLGGALLVARSLARPLERLAGAATRVHQGQFDLEPLPDEGPRELATTSAAFNDMASTLQAVEAKAMALASGELADPVLQAPLPGRTGQALQAAVDRLTTRTREREDQRIQLEEEATHDAMTGLLNRAAALQTLTRDLGRRRREDDPMAVLFVDLDGLKTINDTHGHDVGDAAIVATAEALGRATRQGDIVARLGGDEFLVLLHVSGDDEAAYVADRIRRTVASTSVPAGSTTVELGCTVGVALADEDAVGDPTELIRQADLAMYEARRASRTRSLQPHDDTGSGPVGEIPSTPA